MPVNGRLAVINKPLWVTAGVVAVLAAGGGYLWSHRTAPPNNSPVLSAPPVNPAAPAIEHPLPAESSEAAGLAPLPTLNDSDAAIAAALSSIVGAPAAREFLRSDDIVRRWVVSIDNLPRSKVAAERRPTQPLTSPFIAAGDEAQGTLDPAGFDRYDALVRIIAGIDAQRLTRTYVRFYPLMQRAYENLGYPTGYFNDRLVQAIDVLIAAPQPVGPIELVRPNVMYLFADPTLESLPAGQKLLIRMGPRNAATVKAKLVEVRAALIAAEPKR